MKFVRVLSRRSLLAMFTSVALIFSGGSVFADNVKVAAIYTLPVEQQWISRIHKALNSAKESGGVEYVYSENVSNTDYERVMREYAEQGVHLIVGEVFGLERAARKVANDYPEIAFLMENCPEILKKALQFQAHLAERPKLQTTWRQWQRASGWTSLPDGASVGSWAPQSRACCGRRSSYPSAIWLCPSYAFCRT